MSAWLIVSFFVTAVLYASVGFGGGSTYNALLVLVGTDYVILPAITLCCNIVVVSGGCLQFALRKELPFKAATPFLITSIPFAWIGGRIAIPETVFIGLLATALALAGIRLITQPREQADMSSRKNVPIIAPYIIGGLIGFFSGMVGIGGGIFLAPVLYYLNWDTPRRIAAACSLFIFANSIAGLSGQIAKLGGTDSVHSAITYWPLLIAVLVGGQLGSIAASRRLSPLLIKRMTAVLILFVSGRLFVEWAGMVGL